MRTRDRKFTPSLAGTNLEDRSLLSTFGGGNFDYSRPFVINPSLPASAVNFTSNAYHQVEASIGGVAGNIVKDGGDTNAVFGHLGKITAKVPFGGTLRSILAADLQALQAGGTVAPAAASAVLTELYHDLLGRDPDSIALLDDIPAIQAGTTAKQLARSIVTSDEFILGHTSSKATPLASQTELLDALYGDVLGRVPDGFGANYWVARFNAGVDPRAIAGSFVNSLEASASPTSVLQRVPNPARSTPAYYFGAADADGSLPGPFGGTSKQAEVADLIFADLGAYLDQGEGTTFNVLKGHSNYSTDAYLTFNGRVK